MWTYVTRLNTVCWTYPGLGYRGITAKLRRRNWKVNHKPVLPILRKDGLL